MADLHQLPGAGMQPPATAAAAVHGWAFDSPPQSVPPVVVNPATTTEARAAWAHAQLQQLNVMLQCLGCVQQEVRAELLAGAIRHFTEQAEQVLNPQALGT